MKCKNCGVDIGQHDGRDLIECANYLVGDDSFAELLSKILSAEPEAQEPLKLKDGHWYKMFETDMPALYNKASGLFVFQDGSCGYERDEVAVKEIPKPEAQEPEPIHVDGDYPIGCFGFFDGKKWLPNQLVIDQQERIAELEAEVERLREGLAKHVHTEECFRYAAKTASKHGNAHCIADCSNSHDEYCSGD